MTSTASGVNKKRPATEALENDQRLAKRFNLLNIESNGKLYIPVAANPSALHRESLPNPEPSQHRGAPADDDWMPIDETKDRVYICDLDQELADIESDEENPIFLPDIEKHLNRIPPHVLKTAVPQTTQHNQLVLYSVPQSLSIPEDKDSVRKAIIEARARAGQNWSPSENAQAAPTNTSEPAGGLDFEEMATDGDEFQQDMDVEPMDVE